MTEQAIDVAASVRAIRRSWRLVVPLTALGLAAGAAYVVHDPPMYRASTLVLLPSAISATAGAGTSTADPITTDARIATSAAVLAPAGRTADRSLTLGDLQARVTASSPATSILRITASGPTGRQAQALANAVADELVTFVTTSGVGSRTGTISGLQAESRQLSLQVADVDKEIATVNQRITTEGSASPAGQQDGTLLAKLTSEQSALELQLSTVKSQIAEAQLGQISANQGTRVIQHARSATAPATTSYALPVLLGALGGLLAGSVVALARRRRDPRLATRDALAEALAAPVVLAQAAPACRSPGDWTALFERHRVAAVELWSTRKALRQLDVGEGGGTSLTVLTFAGDPAGTALAVQVALAAASAGTPTQFSVVADGGDAATLRSVCVRFEHQGRIPRPGLRLHDGLPVVDGRPGGFKVNALVVGADDPMLPPTGRATDATTVVSVAAGFASAEELARVAIAASDRGTPIRGILVANPEPDDHSLGRFAGAPGRPSPDQRRHLAPARHRAAGERAT